MSTTMGTAPGAPGIPPTWTSSAKDVVTTTHGPSRLWATTGYGIVNEVYWPSNGEPQIRDLGFIVAGPDGWHEVKREQRYRVELADPAVPLARIVHDGEGYELVLELVPDPLRDVLLIGFRLSGSNLRLYALLAPHLGNSGRDNNARAGDDLIAWRGSAALCLISHPHFARTSAGYVGYSDGWQDFARNGTMRWTYAEALQGNVALMGEIDGGQGMLALGFSQTVEGARTLARSSLADGIDTARARAAAQWQSWASTLTIPAGPEPVRQAAAFSATVLKVHEGRTYPGAVVASLSVPWGNATDSSGGYHLVWTRDAAEVGLAFLVVGAIEDARHMLSYFEATQRDDGGWCQNMFPDGRPFWAGVQLDEVGFPVLLAAKLDELGGLGDIRGVTHMTRRAAAYIAQHGPNSPQDRWEENGGISPFTIAVEIAALVAATARLPPEDRAYALSLADYWNERIEDWTYIEGDEIAQRCGVDGHYVRIAPPALQGGLRGRIELRNRAGESIAAAALVGWEFIYLARLGLRDARDPRIAATLTVAEAMLAVETPQGIAYRRYNEDGYGEHADGSPFDGSGSGRAWPLLVGERGHLDVLRGIDPLPYLETMMRMTGPAGLLPEQVWDAAAIPERALEPGKPSGSAMPLTWAHAEFLKLAAARRSGRPAELLASVERRWGARRPRAAAWHWRASEPFAVLPSGRSLVIEAPQPFLLHYGFDGWQDVRELPSQPLGLGMHGLLFDAAPLDGHDAIDFTARDLATAAWDGTDHRIRLR